MSHKTNSIIFIAGIGAPIEIYDDLIKEIREQIPHQEFHTVQWWDQKDFGKSELKQYLQNTSAILIGHSAGGSISIQTLVDYPNLVQRVVMLDSHTLKGMKPLPSIEAFLDIILSPDSAEVIAKVRKAYVPVLTDSTTFDRPLAFMSNWVQNDFPAIYSKIKTMPNHTVLHLGSTNSTYQVLDAKGEEELKQFWGQHNFDTQFIPMSHFDLITPNCAKLIVEKISAWLERPRS